MMISFVNKLRQEHVVTYTINGKKIAIDLCWQGDDPGLDKDRFYDFYDEDGNCLNLGEPWHDDDEGVPTEAEVLGIFKDWSF